ncbi:porin [uncultured Massilia sp.]|uniref:porin n=1 Tax=uncultured Massilia sp. TaxID=169973 RepID=UPI0025D67846|nr:porin [uncultured Massilia sp.]
MKTSSLRMLAIAAMLPASACAQSNVTIYGAIDAGLRYQTDVDAAGRNQLTATSGNSYSNRLGFRGEESLGNGLTARFRLESGFNSKTGALDNTKNMLFNRTASAGIGGKWGYIDLGRQYTIGFRTELFLDPFDHHFTPIVPISSGAGTSLPAAATAAGLGASASTGTRFNNDVQYTGTFGALTLRAERALGEDPADADRGSASAAGFSYAGTHLLAAGAYTRKETAAGFANRAFIVGGGVKWNGIVAKAGLSRERQDTATQGVLQHELRFAGVRLPVAPALALTTGIYRADYDSAAGGGRRKLYIASLTYAFSKRTNVYAEFDVNRYDGLLVPASQQHGQRGVSLGVMQAF